jgi:hypothetical protein
VLRQVAHWGALLVVIHLLFEVDVQHFLRSETDGFIIVYLLGLASILSGLYLDWKMAVFGLFLIFSVVFAGQNISALYLRQSAAARRGDTPMNIQRFLPRKFPPGMEGLAELTFDLRWSARHSAAALWRTVDAALWEATQNPVLIAEFDDC